MRVSLHVAAIALLSAVIALASPPQGFLPTTRGFAELEQTLTLDNNVPARVNLPSDFDPARPTELIVYFLPNGNTIEQTWGKKLTDGTDWHFDIQHIGAQVRLLRELEKGRNVAVALLEAPGRSWPRFRADHKPDNPELIRALVDKAVATLHAPDAHVSLVAHSGGGSAIFGYINSDRPIPANVDRIAFLDATYAYEAAEHHADKLKSWLAGDPSRRLVVFAYDDRDVAFNGKNIVSPTGGTWYRSHKMIEGLGGESTTDTAGPFQHVSLLAGQAHFYFHANPDRKILHTAMIGEMNAFLQAMTLGTDWETKWGALGGPRAYTRFVEGEQGTSNARNLNLPARRGDVITGSELLNKISPLTREDREELIAREILAGNVPTQARTLVPITVTAAGTSTQHTATYYVTADVMGVGSDADWFRTPLTPVAATRIAKALDCSLITRKISNDVYANAAIKLDPRPLTEKREAPETLYQHHQIIEAQLKEIPAYKPGLLIAGHKKDVVVTPHLKEKPGKVAIYGWHKPDGKPIQPLYLGHVDWYVDYSHSLRLISNTLTVDGQETTVPAVLSDPDLCALLCDEGPVTTGYVATRPATTAP